MITDENQFVFNRDSVNRTFLPFGIGNRKDVLNISSPSASNFMKGVLACLLFACFSSAYGLCKVGNRLRSSSEHRAVAIRFLISKIKWFCIVAFTAMIVQSASHAVQYQIEGTVTFSGKPLREPYNSNFIFWMDDCKWGIKLTRPMVGAPDYSEFYYDGTNVFQVTSLETNVRNRPKDGKQIGNVATAHITKGEIYRNVFAPEVAMIWLTYGSRCYFDTKNVGDLLEPVITHDSNGIIGLQTNIQLYKASWKRQDQFPFLPIEVIYFDSSEIGKSPGQKPSIEFTNSIYHVLSFDNIDGHNIPASTTLETYQWERRATNAMELELFTKYELHLTKLSWSVPRHIPPLLPGPTVFLDERFVNELGTLTYVGSNWISEQGIKSSQDYQARRAEFQKSKNVKNIILHNRNTRTRRGMVVVLLLVLFTIPPILFIRSKYSSLITKGKT